MRLCKDRDCLKFGIALVDSEFGHSEYYRKCGLKDGIDIYCKSCRRRRTREYRLNLQVLIRRTKVKLPASAFHQGVRT